MIPFLPNFKNQFSKDTFSVGLDIGSSAVKIVKLKLLKDSVEFCGFGLEPAQAGLDILLKRWDVKKVNLSVSGPSTIIRYAGFPKMEESELKNALKFEAQKYIPFSIEEVNLDAVILKSNLPDNKILVALSAVKKDFMNQRLNLFKDRSVEINLIDMDSFALINAFNFNYPAKENSRSVALLNVGAALSSLNILEDGIPVLSRDILIAGNNFTQKIMDIFGLNFKFAEELKINPVQEKKEELAQAMEIVFSNLANEVRISMDYCESQSACNVEKIFLSGGTSLLPGLKDSLSTLLGIQVEYWDPLKQIKFSDDIDSVKVKQLSGQLAVAIGLALRR
ncbi:MAG: type IV pilus assembly protein PilM [Candidatus Omnitrophota bacterium]